MKIFWFCYQVIILMFYYDYLIERQQECLDPMPADSICILIWPNRERLALMHVFVSEICHMIVFVFTQVTDANPK